jgi:GNAT superfamily N-acetyltransferase
VAQKIDHSAQAPEAAPLEIRMATAADIPLLLTFIRELAEYERRAHIVEATEQDLHNAMFGDRPIAEAILGFEKDVPVAFATFYYCFSTFLGKPGIYLEDLYVKPRLRGLGHGQTMLAHLAHLTIERGCGRLEWSVLDWNEPAIAFYERLDAKALDEWMTYRLSDGPLEKLAQRVNDPATD